MGGTANDQVHVARLEGSAWEEPWTGVTETLGGINSNQAGGLPSLASIGGYPYVAWADGGGNLDARVARLDTSTFPAPTWTQEATGVSGSDGRSTRPRPRTSAACRLRRCPPGRSGSRCRTSPGTSTSALRAPDGYGLRVARYNKATRTWEQPWPGVTSTFGAIGETARPPMSMTRASRPSAAFHFSRAPPPAWPPGFAISRLEPEFSAESAGPAPGGGEQFSLTARTYGIPLPARVPVRAGARDADLAGCGAGGQRHRDGHQQVGALRANTTYEYRALRDRRGARALAVGATLAFPTNSSGTGVSSGSGTGSNAVVLASVLARAPRAEQVPAPLPAGPACAPPAPQLRDRGHLQPRPGGQSVTFTVTHAEPGRRGTHGGCVKPTGRNRKARPVRPHRHAPRQLRRARRQAGADSFRSPAA